MSSRKLRPDRCLLPRSSKADVLTDHLRLRVAGRLADDLDRNEAEDVGLLTCNSVLRGHDGLRQSARRLGERLPYAEFHFTVRQVADSYALLGWMAHSDSYRVGCGAGSFVIEGANIRMRAIHHDLT